MQPSSILLCRGIALLWLTSPLSLNVVLFIVFELTDGQANRQTNRQTGGQTDRQTVRQTDGRIVTRNAPSLRERRIKAGRQYLQRITITISMALKTRSSVNIVNFCHNYYLDLDSFCSSRSGWCRALVRCSLNQTMENSVYIVYQTQR